MKQNEIVVGGMYRALVNGSLTTVRVDNIGTRSTCRAGALVDATSYHVTNTATNRKTVFRSAAKFRSRVEQVQPVVPTAQELLRPFQPVAKEVQPAAATSPTAVASPRKLAEDPARQAAIASTGTPAAVSVPPVVPNGVSKLASKLQQNSQRVDSDNVPHLIVEARAGTGKTTTLVEGLKRVKGLPSTLVPSEQQAAVWASMELSRNTARTICFVAFNKSIATELQRRVPQGCDAMTMHSMGFKAINKSFNRPRVNEYRVADIIAELLGKDIRDIRRDNPVLVRAVQDLVGLCKMNLVGCDFNEGSSWDEELAQLTSYYDIDTNGSRDQIFELVPQVLDRCMNVQKDNAIDFDDMVWLPVVLNLPVFTYDLLLVDEAQDLNRCQQALAKKAGRRLVLCGDPKQAIYGFAGADAQSMSRMAAELGDTKRGCVTLPLTVTRRCGKAIVAEANKIVKDFAAFDANGEGKVTQARMITKDCPVIPAGEVDYTTVCQAGNMVVCRVNAPLVSQCFRFLKAGRKANIQGRDVGQGLISTINKLSKKGACTVEDLVGKVDDWLQKEMGKENAKRNPSEARLIALQDRADCITTFCEGQDTVQDVIRRIESIFTDDKQVPGIRLSSIHKAKGLEAHRVFLLQPKGCGVPHPMAKTDWQREQEMNLKYVAITRAIEELTYVY